MSRAQRTIFLLVVTGSLYTFLLMYPEFLPSATIQTAILPVLPIWAIVSFGCYLLARLGWGVLNFHDTKDAYIELMGNGDNGIEGARLSLKARGVGTD